MPILGLVGEERTDSAPELSERLDPVDRRRLEKELEHLEKPIRADRETLRRRAKKIKRIKQRLEKAAGVSETAVPMRPGRTPPWADKMLAIVGGWSYLDKIAASNVSYDKGLGGAKVVSFMLPGRGKPNIVAIEHDESRGTYTARFLRIDLRATHTKDVVSREKEKKGLDVDGVRKAFEDATGLKLPPMMRVLDEVAGNGVSAETGSDTYSDNVYKIHDRPVHLKRWLKEHDTEAVVGVIGIEDAHWPSRIMDLKFPKGIREDDAEYVAIYYHPKSKVLVKASWPGGHKASTPKTKVSILPRQASELIDSFDGNWTVLPIKKDKASAETSSIFVSVGVRRIPGKRLADLLGVPVSQVEDGEKNWSNYTRTVKSRKEGEKLAYDLADRLSYQDLVQVYVLDQDYSTMTFKAFKVRDDYNRGGTGKWESASSETAARLARNALGSPTINWKKAFADAGYLERWLRRNKGWAIMMADQDDEYALLYLDPKESVLVEAAYQSMHRGYFVPVQVTARELTTVINRYNEWSVSRLSDYSHQIRWPDPDQASETAADDEMAGKTKIIKQQTRNVSTRPVPGIVEKYRLERGWMEFRSLPDASGGWSWRIVGINPAPFHSSGKVWGYSGGVWKAVGRTGGASTGSTREQAVSVLALDSETAADDDKSDEEKELERSWTRAMVAQTARDLTEALGTAVTTGCLDNKRIRSYREAVTTLLGDYLPESKDASRSVIHAILRDDEMMRVWNAGNGKDGLMLALKGIENRPEDEPPPDDDAETAAASSAHPAWEQAGLARGDGVLVNCGSIDRPRVRIGLVRQTDELAGEALVSVQDGSGSWRNRWYPVNDDPVGIVGIHNGRRCATADVPDWIVGRYLSDDAWVARSLVAASAEGPKYGFPSGSMDIDTVLFRQPETVQVRPVPEWLDHIEPDEKNVLYGLVVQGYDIEAVSRTGAAREDRRLVVRIGTDDSPVAVAHDPGEDEWAVYFEDEPVCRVLPGDLPYNLARFF